jgi:SAM-dependent methyltransferase
MHALKAVFGDRPSDDPLVVGSVKTNLGHLEAAAGVAALIKVVLSMQHGEIPPHLHFKALNPHIALDGFPVTVPTARTPWNARSGRRVAGVSSFGFSGTNAHLVVEEAPAARTPSPKTDRPVHVVTFSAKTENGLKALASRLSEHLASSDPSLADLAFTMNTGRSHFAYRMAIPADSLDSLRKRLAAFGRGERHDDVLHGECIGADAPDVAFEFEGFEADVSPQDLADGYAAQRAFAELLRSWGIEPSSVSGEGQALEAFAASTEPAIPIQQPAPGAITVAIAFGQPAWDQIARTLSSLYVRGVKIDWERFDADYSRNRVPLPTYPFERERYWLDEIASKPAPAVNNFERAVVWGRQQSQQGPFDLALDSHADRLARLDRLTTSYIVAAFRELRAFAVAGESRSAEMLIEEHRILPAYRKLLVRWLGRLASEGLLRQESEMFVADRPLPAPDVRGGLDDVSRFLKPVLIQYVERCGNGLVKVLRGTVSALDTLFPAGSFELGAELYTNAPSARYTNGIVRSVVESVASGSREGVRILEVGAGTGGTTTVVLPALAPDRSTYCFTDMSQLFLSKAQANFRAYPFVQYGILNIEQDPVAQGYPARTFDVVVAANVIHATADLRKSLEHIRSILAPGGLLVLSETTVHHGWFDMTTGLIEGWDRHDDELRGDNPMMSTEQWRAALTATGFEHVMAFPEPGSPAEVLGLHVIVAGVPGGASGARGEIRSIGFGQLAEAAAIDERAARRSEDFLAELAALLPDEQHEMLVAYVRDVVSAVLRLDPSRPPDRRHRLMDLGIDSLMAVELRNRLGVGLGITKTLPATLMFDHPTIEAIAKYLAREVLNVETVQPQRQPELKQNEQPVASQEDVAQMSDEEVEALLLQRLESL